MSALAWCLLLACTATVGDLAVKRTASGSSWRWAALGAAIYAAGTVGWVRVLRTCRLSVVGPLYGSIVVVLLALVGVLLLGERLRLRDLAGIGLALSAILVLREG